MSPNVWIKHQDTRERTHQPPFSFPTLSFSAFCIWLVWQFCFEVRLAALCCAHRTESKRMVVGGMWKKQYGLKMAWKFFIVNFYCSYFYNSDSLQIHLVDVLRVEVFKSLLTLLTYWHMTNGNLWGITWLNGLPLPLEMVVVVRLWWRVEVGGHPHPLPWDLS